MIVLRPEQQHQLIQHLVHLLNIVICAVFGIVDALPTPQMDPEPYHTGTSILSAKGWVLELLTGHPDRIRNELGMHVEVFNKLVTVLRRQGHTNSRSASLEEQLAIFLYTCVTGLPIEHVGERFQQSDETISHYFCKMTDIFSSKPFYTTYVKSPGINPLSPKIRNNPKFWPYFKDTIGAVDRTHLPISPPAHLALPYRNRKGGLSQKYLFTCDFDLRFTSALTGWEGSASDSQIFGDACSRNLEISEGKYLLGDLGFPSRSGLLVPYHGVRSNVAEWGPANMRPIDCFELFNLRHASARCVIEHALSILKKRFRILLLPAHYSDPEIQAQIPVALIAIHNYILSHNPTDLAVVHDNDGEPWDNHDDVAEDVDMTLGKDEALSDTD